MISRSGFKQQMGTRQWTRQLFKLLRNLYSIIRHITCNVTVKGELSVAKFVVEHFSERPFLELVAVHL